jgi:16S rRNA processing protein RimM
VTTVQAEFVTIGRIERPFGVKGEVKVRSLSDVPGRFDRLDKVGIVEAGGRKSERTVAQVRRAGSTYIVRFDGITTPEDAAPLRGALLQIPREPLPVESSDVFYECDLVGLSVFDESGRDLGVVDQLWELPGHHVFVVNRDGRELLIPAAKSFVKTVDVAGGRMVVKEIEDLVVESHAV